ncbi:hypothetical protein [Streptomyces sp. NPDC093990]|uniref:hypothetical protein n=1 Tax=Streptomyces sp. NPDC093990 TaxID=3155306 RepID=UPI0034441244
MTSKAAGGNSGRAGRTREAAGHLHRGLGTAVQCGVDALNETARAEQTAPRLLSAVRRKPGTDSTGLRTVSDAS